MDESNNAHAMTLDQLDHMLAAGAQEVTVAYQRFNRAWPDRHMKEVGLTDLFMMGAREWLIGSGLQDSVVIDWSTNENITGSDFELTVKLDVEGYVFWQHLLCQAKVLNHDGGLPVDVLYQSSLTEKKLGKKVTKDYQCTVLANFAANLDTDYGKKDKNATQKLKGRANAYYVVYDHASVQWMSAKKLSETITQGNKKELEAKWTEIMNSVSSPIFSEAFKLDA